MFRMRAAAVASVIWLVAAASAGEQPSGGFFGVRGEVTRLYGAIASRDLERMRQRSYRQYLDTGQDYFLFRSAALAELAGNDAAEQKALLEILDVEGDNPRFVLFCIEFLRSHGTLEDHTAAVLAKIEALDEKGRLDATRALAFAFAWSEPPADVSEFVLARMAEGVGISDSIYFSRVLAGWGRLEESIKFLTDAGLAAEDLPARLEVTRALSNIGAAASARGIAADTFDSSMPAARATKMPLADLALVREARLSRLCDIASAGAAWDLLIAKAGVQGPKETGIIDRAVILEAARMLPEAAETLGGLGAARPGAEAQALYGSALTKAGDACGGRSILLRVVTRDSEVGEDAYFDLLDALLALRDIPTLKSFAAVYTLAFRQAQQSRAMAEWLRSLGEYGMSDELFKSFVDKTGIGPDTRFAWQGYRLLAIYYLDTGRLEEGHAAALRSLESLVEVPNIRESLRNPAPGQYVALFKRFGGLDDLIAYCRLREKDYPKAVLLYRMEQAALEALGRWDEAIALQDNISGGLDAVNRDLLSAATFARAERWQEAANLYERAIKADPRVPQEAYADLALALCELDRWDDVEGLFAKMHGDENPATFVDLGAFLAGYGKSDLAARAFRRLDDLSMSVDAKQLGAAVHFWIKNGDLETAALALSRRVSLQEDFNSKTAYFREALGSPVGVPQRYLDLGRRLEQSGLATDGRLLAYYYRQLGRLLEKTLYPLAAREAYARAMVLDGDNPENALLMCMATASWREADALEAAAKYVKVFPDATVLLEKARAELALGAVASASETLATVARTPLTTSRAARAVDVLEMHGAPGGFYDTISAGGNTWPWVLVARLADASLAAGAPRSSYVTLAAEAGDGGYVGRALWAADSLVRQGLTDAAGRVLRDREEAYGPHPAVSLLAADIALDSGDATRAGEILQEGLENFSSVEPVRRLFEDALGRIAVTQAVR